MSWCCSMFAVVAVVFSGCFQTVYSVGVPRQNNVWTQVCRSTACCESEQCRSTTARLREKMNMSVDPCVDFHEFACGRFLKEYVLPPDRVDMMSFYHRDEQNNIIMRDLLVNTTNPNRPRYLKNMQRYYNSCMNETQIELLGLAPFLNNREFVDDWPTLNPRWSDAGFDLSEVIARYRKVSISPIFTIVVSHNKTDGTKHAIELEMGDLGYGKAFLNERRNHSNIQAYERQLVEIAVALNASRAVAERDARDVVDLEIEIWKIPVSLQQQLDVTTQMNLVQLSQFSRLYPWLDVARVIRSTFSIVNITLPDDELVINGFPSYMKDIESVLECFPKRTIQNLFGFHYAMMRLSKLTKHMRNITLEYERAIYGLSAPIPDWITCVSNTASSFPMGMSKIFVNRVFSETAKTNVHQMVDKIQEEMRILIQDAVWLSNTTKSQAFKKLAALKRHIGYPDADFEEADIERLYENYTMSEDNYYNNEVIIKEQSVLNKLASLRKPVDKNKWYYDTYLVSAYAARERNQIELLAGIMQEPFYSEKFEDFLNYGSLGVIIGHEITHLFDDMGRHYDEHGNVRNWWTADDRAKFNNRSKCIVDQYSNYYVKEINMNHDGVKTRSESEADTGSIKLAFRAYTKQFTLDGRRFLPNLGLTHEQIFFLSFAQQFCQVATNQRKRFYVQSTVKPLGKYRVIGALQNSEDFARVYNCSLGSYMNPVKKCGVW